MLGYATLPVKWKFNGIGLWLNLCSNISEASVKGFLAPEFYKLSALQELWAFHPVTSFPVSLSLWHGNMLIKSPSWFKQNFAWEFVDWYNTSGDWLVDEPQGIGFGVKPADRFNSARDWKLNQHPKNVCGELELDMKLHYWFCMIFVGLYAFLYFPSLCCRNLQSNVLTGKLPYELGMLRYLEELRLDRNKFIGTIPAANSSQFSAIKHGM